MRWKRAMVSVWVYENTCPTCSDPLTVGGGVSIANTSPRVFDRSNANVRSASQRSAHLSSSPSRLGLSGAPVRSLIRRSLGSDRLALDEFLLDLGPDHGAECDPEQEVERESQDAGELLLGELEHLGDEDLDEDPALEPPVGGHPVVPDPQQAEQHQEAGDDRRQRDCPLLEALDRVVVEAEQHRGSHRGDRVDREPPREEPTEPLVLREAEVRRPDQVTP